MKDLSNFVSWLATQEILVEAQMISEAISQGNVVNAQATGLPSRYSAAYNSIMKYHYEENQFVDDTTDEMAASADAVLANCRSTLLGIKKFFEETRIGITVDGVPSLQPGHLPTSYDNNIYSVSLRDDVVSLTTKQAISLNIWLANGYSRKDSYGYFGCADQFSAIAVKFNNANTSNPVADVRIRINSTWYQVPNTIGCTMTSGVQPGGTQYTFTLDTFTRSDLILSSAPSSIYMIGSGTRSLYDYHRAGSGGSSDFFKVSDILEFSISRDFTPSSIQGELYDQQLVVDSGVDIIEIIQQMFLPIDDILANMPS